MRRTHNINLNLILIHPDFVDHLLMRTANMSQTSTKLPTPPVNGGPQTSGQKSESARLRPNIADCYFAQHAQKSPLDPATFFDKMMTDYTSFEGDPVGKWIANKSPLYKSYNAYINYVVQHGQLDQKKQAKQFQNALSPLIF